MRAPARQDDGAATLEMCWRRMLSLVTMRRDALFAALATHELTPPHGLALAALVDGPIRMRDLAEQMVCDASYITSIVDRLEEAGLAERRADPDDRRAKEIGLTPAGVRFARKIRSTMLAPPSQLNALSAPDRQRLSSIMERIVPHVADVSDPFRPPRR